MENDVVAPRRDQEELQKVISIEGEIKDTEMTARADDDDDREREV